MTDFVELGEVCEFTYGDSLREDRRQAGNVPVYGSNGIVGWHNEPLTRGKTIIVGRKGSIGEVHFSGVPCFPIDTTYFIEKTKEPCDLRWLYYTLVALDLTKLNRSAAVPGLNREDAYEQKIPFPPLPEQQRIAALLDRADHLHRTRRYAQQLSDSFLQAVFVEMFGDPVKNPMGWDKYRLEDIAEINPPTPKVKTLYAEDIVSFIPMADVDENLFTTNVSEKKKYQEVSKNFTIFQENDVLFAKITPCMENGKIVLAKNLLHGLGFGSTEFHVIRNTDQTISEWLLWLVRRKEFRNLAVRAFTGTAGQQRVPSSFLENYNAPLPPLHLQQKFARVVQQFKRLRAQQREAERQAEHLFQTLLQRAFRGEV